MPKPDIELPALNALLQRLFPGESVSSERVTSGGSTQVYKIDVGSEPLYLRFGEDAGDTFAPEVMVHRLLHEQGARVPEVVLFEDRAPEVDRSIMVTKEIPGAPLQAGGTGSEGIGRSFDTLRAAGVDLARVNSMHVTGFGFVDRTRPWSGKLTGTYPSFREWSVETFDCPASTLGFFSDSDSIAIDRCGSRMLDLDHGAEAYLAHGDFDTSHIFSDERGYSGLIDFGEIRGTDRWYDLADFLVHIGGNVELAAFRALLDGYRTLSPVNEEQLGEIEVRAVTLGISLLRRIRGRGLADYEALMTRSIKTVLTSERLRPLIG